MRTGNRLFVGTTGGGVWLSQNAATSNPANIVFVPLTDNLAAMSNAVDASISIGALSVQPGGTGVILAGTGDPNDALDSYYGAGILRSTDGGTTWTLIQAATSKFNFLGEGFAGFAWSTVNPQLVVAAVSQAWEGVLVGAQRSQQSYEGLYYSTDSGATWSLAQITDLNGQDVQGPLDAFTNPDGNAATSVVWNPFRGLFIAAVRFHGYYQSTDGAHWTRLAAQPGCGADTSHVSHSTRVDRLSRMPDVSRNAGGESANWRYLRVECRCGRPGSGHLAGRMRGWRKCLRQPGDCLGKAMEHFGP